MLTETNVARKASQALARVENKVRYSDLSRGTPSRPLLGLPLKRLVPQDIHTAGDHAAAFTNVVASRFAETPAAMAAPLAIAGTAMSVSLLTDYRLSVAKLIPIEVHEAVDWLTAASNVLSPFLFGYYKKSPVTAALQIANGVAVMLTSLFTDYRAYKGVRWGGRRLRSAEAIA